MFCLMTHVPETGTRKWYRFFSACFLYQLRLVSTFLVPETNMADDTVAVGAVGILVAIAAKEKEKERFGCSRGLPTKRHMAHTTLVNII